MPSDALPKPVRDYLAAALPGQPARVHRVRVTQTGEMVTKPGGRPLRFEAVEEFEVDRVAFAWRARFPVLGPLALRVTDSYDPPDGRLEVRVLGVAIQRRRGPELAQGEAFRYLAEIPWGPHAVRANGELEWREIDEATAEVATVVGGERLAVRLGFDGTDVIQTSASRPRLEAHGALTRWIGEYSDYTSLRGIRVPRHGEVRWELPEGPFTYWRGAITDVEAVPA